MSAALRPDFSLERCSSAILEQSPIETKMKEKEFDTNLASIHSVYRRPLENQACHDESWKKILGQWMEALLGLGECATSGHSKPKKAVASQTSGYYIIVSTSQKGKNYKNNI